MLIDVRELGAANDGSAIATAVLQQAIDRAGEGGGTVHVPPGVYLTGCLELRSGVTLQLDPAAVLRGSPDLADYARHDGHGIVGDGYHLLFANGVEDVRICGGGTLDGNGPAFWELAEGPNEWHRPRRDPPRVHPLVELRSCRRLTVENVRIVNSPGWTVHPHCCDHLTIRGVTIGNDLWGPNTDDIDLDGSRDVFISDCKLTSGAGSRLCGGPWPP